MPLRSTLTRRITPILLWAAVAGPITTQVSAQTRTFKAEGSRFVLNGKPFQIVAGDMDYARIPRAYWHDRLRKAKAMGLNTITVYAFWNLHEPAPGVYDFHGQNDLGAYLRAAQEEGLYVIFRPGPYVCAEWELGGYPAWLLKAPATVLRSEDPRYTAAVSTWFERLGKEIRPLLLKNGGPVIAVQVENEYGAFGDNRAYLELVKRQIINAGLGDALLFTANQSSDLEKGSLPELPAAVNFGTGDARQSFARLEAFRPEGTRLSGEYWAGWFDKWGEKHHETNGEEEAKELRWMLAQGFSVSLYMFHGGTTFGWMNGADSHTGKDYHPDTTSYDYDAPLDEAGSPRYKYGLFRQVIAETTHTVLVPEPAKVDLGQFKVRPIVRSASLWNNLPAPVLGNDPLSFEDLDQSYGYVLYRTKLPRSAGGTLALPQMHDYAQIYINQSLVGTLDRRLGQTQLEIAAGDRPRTLDILVENTGRVNYSVAIRGERTGLIGGASFKGAPLHHWSMYRLPMNDVTALKFNAEPCSGPCFYQTAMQVATPQDTYLDTRRLHKGQLWLGDHNLGRFWSVGPQFALYAPAPWQTEGESLITVFDLEGTADEQLTTANHPIYGETVGVREAQ